MTTSTDLTHLDDRGHARMVDVAHKTATQRLAVARSVVRMAPEVLTAISDGTVPKGDVLAVARIAGIQGAKQCANLIPLCHPLPISSVEVELTVDTAVPGVIIDATVGVVGPTGVEMEALTAASIAALTIYDMCKALDKGIVIHETVLLKKMGGKSGLWER
jgi:cyclic pyranopterin phosphate synthase